MSCSLKQGSKEAANSLKVVILRKSQSKKDLIQKDKVWFKITLHMGSNLMLRAGAQSKKLG